MVRPAIAALALLLVPSVAPAQQAAARTHTVEPGNTLWHLARAYYGDPYLWPRIFEVNRDRLDDPDLLEPGLVLRIPGEAAGAVVAVSVQGAVQVPEAAEAVTPSEPPAPSAPRRTSFYSEPAPEAARRAAPPAGFAFSEDDFHRAPWLVPPEEGSGASGTVSGTGPDTGARLGLRPFDQARIAVDGTAGVGSRFQAFRVERRAGGVGRVAVPTGTLRVVERDGEGALATVENVYGRMAPGDLLRPLPAFPLRRGAVSRPVDAAVRATVVGFPERRGLYHMGDYLFLGTGGGEGLRVGDELEVVWEGVPDGEAPPGGTVQVISVQGGHATARIVALANPVFETGVVLRLSRRMQ